MSLDVLFGFLDVEIESFFENSLNRLQSLPISLHFLLFRGEIIDISIVGCYLFFQLGHTSSLFF